MGILDKAKAATSSTLEGVKEKVSSKAGELKDQAAQKAGEVMEGGAARLREALAEFSSAVPILKQAGYSLSEVAIELGLPPKIVASFKIDRVLDEAMLSEIEREHADNKIAVTLIKSLGQARAIQDKVTVAGLAPCGIAIELGLIPSVIIKYG